MKSGGKGGGTFLLELKLFILWLPIYIGEIGLLIGNLLIFCGWLDGGLTCGGGGTNFLRDDINLSLSFATFNCLFI